MNNCVFNSYILLIFSYFGICKRTNISAMIPGTSVLIVVLANIGYNFIY